MSGSSDTGDGCLGACILMALIVTVAFVTYWRTNCAWEKYLVEEEVGAYSVINSRGDIRFELNYGKTYNDKEQASVSD